MKEINNESKSKDIFSIITILANYYHYDTSDSVKKLYASALSGYDIEIIKKAINLHVKDTSCGQYMPKISHLISQINKLTGENLEYMAVISWDAVMNAVRLKGRYTSVRFDDPIIHAVIKSMGGWLYFCNLEDRNYAQVQREFERRYKMFSNQKPGAVPTYFLGEHSRLPHDLQKTISCEDFSTINLPEDIVFISTKNSKCLLN